MTYFLNILNNSARDKLIKTGAVLLILFFAFYLYLVGSLVGGGAQERYLLGIFEEAKQELHRAESLFMAEENNFQLSFFKEQGYEESAKFDLIKPTSNVAGIAQSLIHQ